MSNHVAHNAIATDMIPIDRMDVLRSVAVQLRQDEERACIDNIYLQRMKARGVRRGKKKKRVAGW